MSPFGVAGVVSLESWVECILVWLYFDRGCGVGVGEAIILMSPP